MGWQWHQLDHNMLIIFSSLQTDNHAITSSLNFLPAGYSSWRPTNSVKALKALFCLGYMTVGNNSPRNLATVMMVNCCKESSICLQWTSCQCSAYGGWKRLSRNTKDSTVCRLAHKKVEHICFMLSIAHCSIMAGSNENKEFIFCAILLILRSRFESIQRMLRYM